MLLRSKGGDETKNVYVVSDEDMAREIENVLIRQGIDLGEPYIAERRKVHAYIIAKMKAEEAGSGGVKQTVVSAIINWSVPALFGLIILGALAYIKGDRL